MVDIISIIIASSSLILGIYNHIKSSKCGCFQIRTIYDNEQPQIHIHTDSPSQIKRNIETQTDLKVKLY